MVFFGGIKTNDADRMIRMARYVVHAYDTNHNELWITIGSSHVDAEAHRSTDRIGDVINTYDLVRTGKIIDPETGLPVVRRRDPNTGQRTQGARYVAYFRAYDNNAIFEIYVTRHGRKAGVRNYQTRRPGDCRAATIIGCKPIHTGPRVVNTGYNYQLIIGEGDPNGLRLRGNRNIDQWGDPVVHIATCSRVTLAESDGGWWGYTYNNHCTWYDCPLEQANLLDVYQHLDAVAKEMIDTYGVDITSW